jgi:hypothetical protein
MTTRLPIDIETNYITKPLHSDTLTATLKDNSSQILHRLYLITNGLKDRQPFLEIESEDYNITANVIIKHGYAQDAKEQASVLKIMKQRIAVRPEYTISFSITRKQDTVTVFNFKHTTTNKQEVYNLTSMLETKVKGLI